LFANGHGGGPTSNNIFEGRVPSTDYGEGSSSFSEFSKFQGNPAEQTSLKLGGFGFLTLKR
jgi:hypothetical protein